MKAFSVEGERRNNETILEKDNNVCRHGTFPLPLEANFHPMPSFVSNVGEI